MSYRRIAVVVGDDAAPDAVRAAMTVVDAAGAGIEWVVVDPDDVDGARRSIDSCDATLFGAASGRSLPLLIHLRWVRDTYANVRPIRHLPGARSPLSRPQGIDFVIVRENIEDLYLGVEGPLSDLASLDARDRVGRLVVAGGEGRYALKVITRERTERVARAALRLARHRARPRVTVGTKHNVLPRSDGFFLEIVRAVAAAEFPDVAVESRIVDDLANRLVAAPHDLDVVLLPNLYGDILSDTAAALIGGLGMAPSGCYGDDYAYFEPAHGTAPDLAGRGIINPTAQLLSAAMMLDHVGATRAGHRVRQAVAGVYASGETLTPDQGGTASTTEFTRAVVHRLEEGDLAHQRIGTVA